MRHIHLSLLMIMPLIGCDISSPQGLVSVAPSSTPGTPSNPPPATSQACITSDCATLTRALDLPDAENIIFSDDGRLFVTGDRVYEVIRDGSGVLQKTVIDSGGCTGPGAEFLGLTIRENVLYTHCNGNSMIYAGYLNNTPMMVSPIYTLTGMFLPNGSATDNQGRIYIVDGPFYAGLPSPQIVRVTLDPSDPLVVLQQEQWTTTDLEVPNGLAFDGTHFYVTDSSPGSGQQGNVKRIPLNSDGSAGAVETIYVHDAVLDDLSILDDNRLLVSDFTQGRVFILNKDGTRESITDPFTVVAAAAVQVGRPPLFSHEAVLVLDKGVLGERASNNGNAMFVLE